jgi:tetratricopeptide (TPR) repeat protein
MLSQPVPIGREGETPRKTEVLGQLKRMRATPRFRNAGNPSDFLELVVRRALRGKKTPGRVIAQELFPDLPPINVRVTADNLRKTLKKYYAQEGHEDLVIIALPDPPKNHVKLPEGEAYTPLFSYNPNHALSKALRLGEHHLVRGTHADLNYAIEYFSKALEFSPLHARAHIGIAEALCNSLGWIAKEITDSETDDILSRTAEILNRVGEEASGYWRLHAAAGMFFLAVGDLEEARERFDAALALDRSTTETYPAYLGFLVASGKPTRAVELARRYLTLNIDNPGAYATCAMTMAIAGEIPQAEEVINQALQLDKGHPGIRMLATAFKLANAPGLEAQEFSRLSAILDDTSYGLLKREFLVRGALIPDPEP